MLMDTNDGTVDENLFKIRVFGQFLEHLGPYFALLPTRESLVFRVSKVSEGISWDSDQIR